MLRVSKITDHGIVILSNLASEPDGSTQSAREIAAEARLPLPVVSKTLKRLARAGILESHRGAKGGYALARSPAEITLADAITALEGPIGLMECSVHLGQCSHESTCTIRGPWQRVNDEIRASLERITISELLPTPGGDGELIPLRVASGDRRR
ncbi:MAG: SUF system Fe-S cluster assembly regulator [Deltaproteobacteria bacterium]|nr:MAG: SUF system Fe-S cluster assembly regulator [Deltaproteobacteria bacterium]